MFRICQKNKVTFSNSFDPTTHPITHCLDACTNSENNKSVILELLSIKFKWEKVGCTSCDAIGNSIDAIGNGSNSPNDAAWDPTSHCIRDCANAVYGPWKRRWDSKWLDRYLKNTFSHARNRGSDVYGVAKAVDDVAQRVGVLEDLVGQAVVVLSPVCLLVWKGILISSHKRFIDYFPLIEVRIKASNIIRIYYIYSKWYYLAPQ